MKKIDWEKAFKTIGILIIIGLVVWYFDSRGNKRASDISKHTAILSSVSDELTSIMNDCSDALDSEDYDLMAETLSIIESKCEELRMDIDEAYYYFESDGPDLDERRSSF